MELEELQAFEQRARTTKIEQIMARQAEDSARMAELAALDAARAERRPEVLEALSRFIADHDGDAFAIFMEAWSRKPGYDGFKGTGQMFLKQVLKSGEPGEASRLLAEVLRAPVDDAEAVSKIDRTLVFVDRVKSGGYPAPGRVPFLLSFFWGLQDDQRWPVIWSSAKKGLTELGWINDDAEYAEQYLEFIEIVRSAGDPVQVVHALYWFKDNTFVGLAPNLIERCQHASDLAEETDDSGYASPEMDRVAEINTLALTREVLLAARALQEQVADVLGRPVKVGTRSRKSGEVMHRWWAVSSWQPKGERVSIQIAATVDGVLVTLFPGWVNGAWYSRAATIAKELRPDGLEFFRLNDGIDHGSFPSTGNEPSSDGFMLGRLFPDTTALDRVDLADDILGVVAELQPLVDRLTAATAAGDQEAEPPAKAEPAEGTHPGGELSDLVAMFKSETKYPSEQDQRHRSDREQFAKLLTKEALEVAEPSSLSPIINTQRYGGPGPQSVLNSTVAKLDGAGQEKFLALVSHVLWGPGSFEDRLDHALDPENSFSGLAEGVLMKVLAIAHPERFLPVFPYIGENGKAAMMGLIGLERPSTSDSRGQKQVRSNDALHRALEPYLPGDTWAQSRFLYWLKTHEVADSSEASEMDPVPGLADELLLPEPYIAGLIHLLRDKGQIVLYGPPGTGKTYVAQKVAEALAEDPARRTLVQFHPSTSYEDFFEGYRPEPGVDGQLTYRLVQGPLARMATAAEASPGIDHVMVIDEINRANLPKVLGELLFLLEYREEPVQTLYRPDEPFSLPPNLYLIGTMNTADRSVALIDAAMRRRFHFLPFFPHEDPHSEVLAQWLDKKNRDMAWVAGFLEHVNSRLVKDLGGPHLQIGPSHFMKKGLNRAELETIWRYSIMPFIEDQLWGQADLISSYGFDNAYAAYQKESGGDPDELGGTPPADQTAGGGDGGAALAGVDTEGGTSAAGQVDDGLAGAGPG